MLVIPDFLMQKLAEFANTTQTEVALISVYRGIRTQVTVFPTEHMEEHLVLDATPPAKLEELLTNLSADLRERVTLYYTVTSRRENEDSFYCSDAVKNYLSVSLLQAQPRSQLEQLKYQSTEKENRCE